MKYEIAGAPPGGSRHLRRAMAAPEETFLGAVRVQEFLTRTGGADPVAGPVEPSITVSATSTASRPETPSSTAH